MITATSATAPKTDQTRPGLSRRVGARALRMPIAVPAGEARNEAITKRTP